MRLQSAIEYLVTYGWAIIIIGIVIAALFALHVFNPSVQTQCVLQAGFSCENLFLAQNGILIVNLLQTTSGPINITGIECNTNNSITNTMLVKPNNPPSNQISIPTDDNYSFAGVQCYQNGVAYSASSGSVYTGALILNYTEQYTGFQHTVYGKIVVQVS